MFNIKMTPLALKQLEEITKRKPKQKLLKQMISLPLEEAWPYQDPEILSNVLKGIEEAKAGKAKPFDLKKLKELDDV